MIKGVDLEQKNEKIQEDTVVRFELTEFSVPEGFIKRATNSVLLIESRHDQR